MVSMEGYCYYNYFMHQLASLVWSDGFDTLMQQRNNEIVKKLTCHCGGVEIEILLPKGLKNLGKCNCSICKRRSAIMAKVNLEDLRVVKGKEKLKLYQFHTHKAEHYFCSVCGIYTHHKQRSDPNKYAFNVACLENVNPFDLGDIPVFDGVNHPGDKIK